MGDRLGLSGANRAFMLHHIRASPKFLGGKNEPEGISCWMAQLSHIE